MSLSLICTLLTRIGAKPLKRDCRANQKVYSEAWRTTSTSIWQMLGLMLYEDQGTHLFAESEKGTCMNSKSTEQKTGQLVLPGERLGVIEEFTPDTGTFVKDGVIQ